MAGGLAMLTWPRCTTSLVLRVDVGSADRHWQRMRRSRRANVSWI